MVTSTDFWGARQGLYTTFAELGATGQARVQGPPKQLARQDARRARDESSEFSYDCRIASARVATSERAMFDWCAPDSTSPRRPSPTVCPLR